MTSSPRLARAAAAATVVGVLLSGCGGNGDPSSAKKSDAGAAADLGCRFHDHDLAVGRHDAPRRGNSGRSRADHDDVGLARQGCGSRAQDRHRGKSRRRR